jgi:hypothetical protein
LGLLGVGGMVSLERRKGRMRPNFGQILPFCRRLQNLDESSSFAEDSFGSFGSFGSPPSMDTFELLV